METLIAIWVIAGILGYGQFWFNQTLSVQYQKKITQNMETYTGWNPIEAVIFFLMQIFFLIGSIIGGVLWFVLNQIAFRKLSNDRLRVEKINWKVFKHGWCS